MENSYSMKITSFQQNITYTFIESQKFTKINHRERGGQSCSEN